MRRALPDLAPIWRETSSTVEGSDSGDSGELLESLGAFSHQATAQTPAKEAQTPAKKAADCCDASPNYLPGIVSASQGAYLFSGSLPPGKRASPAPLPPPSHLPSLCGVRAGNWGGTCFCFSAAVSSRGAMTCSGALS